MLTVCTGWSPTGWTEYAWKFMESFNRHWGKARFVAYTEVPYHLPRGENKLIWDIPGCRDFIERHQNSAKARGKAVKPDWKQSAKAQGYNWRFDAWKWCRQGFIPLAVAEQMGRGLLCWLDADVVTFEDMPDGFIESLLPEGKDLAYLGRGRKYHSEIGFQLYRLPEALPMLRRFRDYYATDEVFHLGEWHSAYVFDRAREETGIKAHDLTPDGTGHVWWQSPLCKYMDHLKGNRKNTGQSSQRQS